MPDTRFLGVFSRHGIELVLEESGLMDRLRQQGFSALRVGMDLDDPMGHTLRIQAGEIDPQVVVEMKLRVNRKMEPGREGASSRLRCVLSTGSRYLSTDCLTPLWSGTAAAIQRSREWMYGHSSRIHRSSSQTR